MHRRDGLAMNNKPTLNVFVPVHNEERYLQKTLSSIEAAANFYEMQGKRLKVTISNNASTDKSLDIIKNFAEKKPEWEILDTRKELSGDQHFNNLIQSCTTDYVCIVGGHDLVSEGYFYELEKTLRINRGSPLVFCSEFIDLEGLGQSAHKVDFEYNFSSEDIIRFWQSILYLGNATCIQGVIETRKLQEIHAFESKVSDLVWLHGLLRFGKFIYTENASYIRTNPIRPVGYRNPKIRKLLSDRTTMEVSLLTAWTPPELSIVSKRLARFVILLKFSTKSHHVFLFRVFRRISQVFIVPPAGSKDTSSQGAPIVEILPVPSRRMP